MKTTSLTQILHPTKLLALAAALALQVGPPAQAQPEPDRPYRPNPPGNEARHNQPGGPGGFRGGPNQGQPLMEQVLTEDQRDSLRQTMESQREKMRGLQEKIREARKALMTAALANEFKDDVVKAKALEVAKLEAEVSVLRLKAFSEVQPALSKEQLEKILNPPQPQGMGPDGGGNRPPNRTGNRPQRNADGEPLPPPQNNRQP
jgi:Spy/CpxP family protein refolding chaperone